MRILAVLAVVFLSLSARAETIKIAFIDPLSGPAAAVTQNGLDHFRFMAARLSDSRWQFEVTGFDNKLNPQETIVQAQKAVDAGIRILAQGNGSGAAGALADFVVKHNERNPDAAVLYLNYAAIDPALTNEKCSPWHFRFDAHAGMKMKALATVLARQKAVKKVYLINQDYSFGRAVRDSARAMLAAARPDIEIVGDELHPLAKITDFSPYVAKIRASGADSVITGNWGSDLALLLKAAGESGLQAGWYTYYASGIGSPTAVKQSGLAHRVFAVIEGHPNLPQQGDIEERWRAQHGGSFNVPRIGLAMEMLKAAAVKAGSAEPAAIGRALAGLQQKTPYGGLATMRAADHQLLQDLYVASFGPLQGDMRLDEEGTGWGWKSAGMVKAADTALPTTCVMPAFR
ncbi:branched-chain amino acid ABC transporter substrate-binding protein [Ferrovibrio sp.]|uniref:branched-chain amino acid ABC transporter substrate-binding protein n=1 Tax=Ferrovibrio sp. TaxID=1917215 RepID=UPI00311EACCC